MPATILLISINRCATPYPVYPLGVSHVAAALRRDGHQVTMADMGIEPDRLEAVVSSTAPDYIGLSLRNIDDHRIDGTVFYIPELFDTIERLRRITDAKLILGGSAYSLFPEMLLEKTGADYGIAGEGDRAMPELIGMLSRKGSPAASDCATINGLVYRRGDTIVRNAAVALEPHTIPVPYRPEVIFDYYLERSGIANVQTQRGCPFTCCYCSYPLIEGTVMRQRDAAAVVDEIEEAAARGARYFFFVDSVFNIDDHHVAAVCEELIARGIGISWGCYLRPKGISKEMMELMARAGLRHIEFGTDSLCDAVLAAYGKQLTVDDIVRADERANTARVRHAHFLICGGPGETAATLRESFNNSLRLKKTAIFPFVGMRLYPGTPLHRRVLMEGSVTPRTDLLEPYFYITPGLTKETIAAILDGFHRQSPRWVVGDPLPELQKVIERLRAKSIPGPLWEFLAQ